MNRKSAPIPEPIAQLQRQLEQFRSTQSGRTKLPESLWQAAVELARQYGVYPVAHPLRLDYTRLAEEANSVGLPSADREGLPSQHSSSSSRWPHQRLRRVRDRVRVLVAGARCRIPVEVHRAARLDEPAARLARRGAMIQITSSDAGTGGYRSRSMGVRALIPLARLCQGKALRRSILRLCVRFSEP